MVANGYDVAVNQTDDEIEIAYEAATKQGICPTILNEEEADLIDSYCSATSMRKESDDEEPLINILNDIIMAYQSNRLRYEFGKDETGLQHLDIVENETSEI